MTNPKIAEVVERLMDELALRHEHPLIHDARHTADIRAILADHARLSTALDAMTAERDGLVETLDAYPKVGTDPAHKGYPCQWERITPEQVQAMIDEPGRDEVLEEAVDDAA